MLLKFWLVVQVNPSPGLELLVQELHYLVVPIESAQILIAAGADGASSEECRGSAAARRPASGVSAAGCRLCWWCLRVWACPQAARFLASGRRGCWVPAYKSPAGRLAESYGSVAALGGPPAVIVACSRLAARDRCKAGTAAGFPASAPPCDDGVSASLKSLAGVTHVGQ
jgi:hypothetical protein